jgi:hypothetical protein
MLHPHSIMFEPLLFGQEVLVGQMSRICEVTVIAPVQLPIELQILRTLATVPFLVLSIYPRRICAQLHAYDDKGVVTSRPGNPDLKFSI